MRALSTPGTQPILPDVQSWSLPDTPLFLHHHHHHHLLPNAPNMRLVYNSMYQEFGTAQAWGPEQEMSAKLLSAIAVLKLITIPLSVPPSSHAPLANSQDS